VRTLFRNLQLYVFFNTNFRFWHAIRKLINLLSFFDIKSAGFSGPGFRRSVRMTSIARWDSPGAGTLFMMDLSRILLSLFFILNFDYFFKDANFDLKFTDISNFMLRISIFFFFFFFVVCAFQFLVMCFEFSIFQLRISIFRYKI
jgi:hypothetical protein